jgi:hypothetical protein
MCAMNWPHGLLFSICEQDILVSMITPPSYRTNLSLTVLDLTLDRPAVEDKGVPDCWNSNLRGLPFQTFTRRDLTNIDGKLIE